MRLLVLILVVVTEIAGCASTKVASSYDRRKELFEERYEWSRSTGADYSHGNLPSTRRNP